MVNPYDARYDGPGYYWGRKPSSNCIRVLQLMPPDRPLRLLDIGCGEGRDAVFLARNGYLVKAFDASPRGVEKTRQLAEEAGVHVESFIADINEYRIDEPFDVLFSTGVFQYVPQEGREALFEHYREKTAPGGLNAFSALVRKPFIPKAPDGEPSAHCWISGELLTYYRDWKIEYSAEEIFDCMSSGVPHQHAINRMIARNPAGGFPRMPAFPPLPKR